MDRAPVDRAVAWEVAAAAAARAVANDVNALSQRDVIEFDGSSWAAEDQEPKKRKVEVRSILVRDLPRHLGTEESTEALRTLFSEAASTYGLACGFLKESQTQSSRLPPPPVAARPGSLPQSSWQNNRRYGSDGHRDAIKKNDAFLNQRKELLKQLPHAVSSIRIATDELGGSTYAFVDFPDEILARTAFQLLGQSAYLPGISSPVRLSLHETWSSPVVVDQYHLYLAGLPAGATTEYVEALVRAVTGVNPTHVKMSSVSGIPSRRGIREYSFLRFLHENAADAALEKLENASASLQLMVKRVHKHRRRGTPTEPLSHAANCSIFIANLPPLTNSDELREICSYFHVVPAAEVHPTRNYGFVRLASHDAALAAITHLHGTQLRGRTLACAWSSRNLALNEEEPRNDAWERAEEAYAVMSAQCMDFEEQTAQQPHCRKSGFTPKMSPGRAAKKAASETAGEAFWLSFLADGGPVSISDICYQLEQRHQEAQYRQARLQQWHAQEWEENVEETTCEVAEAVTSEK